MIDIWTDTSSRWLNDIKNRAEEIRILETKLIESRGAIAELKYRYLESYLKESGFYIWNHPKAVIGGETYILNRIALRGDGDCVLDFSNILKSGKPSKYGIIVPFNKIDRIEWIKDKQADQSQ